MKFASCAAALLLVLSIGCASRHEKGVRSDYRTQWTNVNADTQTTTEAAEAVLEEHDLKDVTSSSTAVDGVAQAKQADGTNVKVDVKKEGTGSQVSVTVGRLGNPELGAELANDIKARAERRE